MSKRTLVKGISILMSFVLLVLAFPLNVFADNADDVNITQPEEQQNFSLPINEDTNGLTATSTSGATFIKPGDKTIAELQEMTFDAESMPEFVNMEVAEEKEHVHRLTAQESSLSTVAYQNRDGSKSVYIFSKPVKYVDSEGNIKDKSSKISSVADDTYSYAMLDNNIKVYFPKNVTNGTYLTVGDYNIKMSPKTTESSSPMYGSDGKVIYNGAFGRNTMLVYETKLNGVKEDIVLVKNTGINEFEFELETRLVPTLTNGVWYLANESGARIASFEDIIIKDSAGNQILGNMAVTSSDTVGKYNVTITAPSDFLNADTTVYPVYIDPTVYIYEKYVIPFTDIGYDTILDVGLYQTEYTKEYSESTPDRHYLSKDYEQGKIIYKFYDFYGGIGAYKDLNSNQIASAKLYFYAESGILSDTITASPMMTTWDISEVGNNPIALCDSNLWNSYSTLYQSTTTIDATAGQKTINITNIVKQWAKYNNCLTGAAYADPENGLVLSCNSAAELDGREILSIENSVNSNDVYMVLDIGEYGGNYYISNEDTGKYLGLIVEWDEMSDLSALELTNGTASTAINSSSYKWIFQYIGSGRYYIYLEDEQNYGLGRDYSDNLVACDMSDFDYERAWQIETGINGIIIKSVVTARADKVIYASPNYDFYLSSPSSYGSSMYSKSLMTLDTVYSLANVRISYSADWVSVGTNMSPTITLNLSNTITIPARVFEWCSLDLSVATVDKDGNIETKKSGIAAITATYKADPEISINIYIEVGQMIPNGTYQIANIHSGNYIAVENASTTEGAYIEQAEPNAQSEQNWIITFDSSGYYYIKSAKSNKYMTVSGNNIIQVSNMATATRWRFICTGNGYYKLIPENATSGYVLSLASSNAGNGDNLISKLYVNDSSYIDEWAIILPMSGYELVYDTSLWVGTVENNNNCYAYAINNQILSSGDIWYMQQPGAYAESEGVIIPEIDSTTITAAEFMGTSVITFTELDFEQFSEDQNTQYVFQSIGKYDRCPTGSYKVALIVGDLDYHWYRQNSDGTWSHKPGRTPVTDVDDSDRIIYDPLLSDWSETYNLFMGYFAVTPWNQYYN